MLTLGDSRAWAAVKGYILRSAEKMPEENYAFRPTPEVRRFGAILEHIADEHYLARAAGKGEKKDMAVEKTQTTKAHLVAALDITHDYEHYGNLITYLRMKGLAPPSSERRQ